MKKLTAKNIKELEAESVKFRFYNVLRSLFLQNRPALYALATLILSLFMTFFGFGIARTASERNKKAQFDLLAEQIKEVVSQRMRHYEEILRSGAAVFAVSRSVERDEWKNFAEFIAIQERYPGIFGVGFIEYVPRDRLDDFLKAAREEVDPDFNIKRLSDATSAEDCFIIKYIEPIEKNLPALGLDIASETNRRLAAKAACDAGLPKLTRKIVLVQDNGKQPGFLMYMPVYRNGMPHSTVEERRAALHGWVYSPFLIDELMKELFQDGIAEAKVEIFDGQSISPEAVIYDSNDFDEKMEGSPYIPSLQKIVRLDMFGQIWSLQIESSPAFDRTHRNYDPFLILLAGLVASFLLSGIVLSIASMRKRALSLADDMTKAFRAGEARFRSIIDNMIEGMIAVNQQGHIVLVNPAAEKIFGYEQKELLNRHLKILVPESAGSDPIKFLTEAYKRSIKGASQWEGKRKNGQVFPFELTLFEFQTEKGLFIAGIIRDLTERHEIERLKKEFISTVSHELRTPLTSIRGSLSLLASGVLGDLNEEASEVVMIAERNSIRLIGLINDILDIERLESGKMEMHFADIPVSKIFERSLESVSAFAEEQGVSIEFEQTEALMHGDEDRLVQVLVNLLSNGVKFSLKGSLVKVSVEESSQWTTVKVIDQGRGVPPHYKETIFERFRQVESSDSRQKGGTGLGLAICKMIVEQHKGVIGVESEEDKGSVFWFRVPAAKDKISKRDPKPEKEPLPL